MTSTSEASRNNQFRTYDRETSVVFLKTKERFGGLSNMAGGFPLRVNGVRIRTSEALYQACRFPHLPDVQRTIIDERSPMTAKMRSKPFREDSRPDWDAVRVKIMRWSLRVKLAQNWNEFGRLLLSTGDRPIVEQSRKDDFWGAKVIDDGTLVGMNVLGRLLMELREQLKGDEAESLHEIEPLSIPEFLLFRQPIEVICAAGGSRRPVGLDARHERPVAPPPPRDLPQPSLFDQPMIDKGQMDIKTDRAAEAENTIGPKPYSGYRDSAHDWLGAAPEHWKVVRSKYLFREVDERTDTGTETLLSMRQAHGLIPHNKVSTKPVTPEDLKGYKRVQAGQMVLNRMQASNGMFAVAREDGLVSPDYAVFRLLQPIEPDYFVNLFKTNIYRAKFRQESKGLGTGMSGFLRLYSDRFGTIPMPQPPEDEQRRIVEFIHSYDLRVRRLIRNKRRLIGLLNEQKQAIINGAVTRGLNPDAAMKPTGIAWMPEIPEKWVITPLRHLSTCLDGKRVPLEASAREKMLGNIPYWGANQIIDHLNDFLLDEDLILLGEDGAPFFDRNKPVAFFSQGKVWPNNHIHVLRPKPGNRPEFIVHALNCVDYTNYVGGATRDKLTQSFMKAIPIPIPPENEQIAILEHVTRECTPLDETAERAAREIGFIQEYRERLVADVVTGKLDVRHIEIAALANEPIADEDDTLEDLEGDDPEVMVRADADE
ncbi:type I restriction enzyme, S subunit [Poseidonocella pacifica]|uniref:Type I restriction enzyme, S subunit n=1 Tax=Poseidonocella pacifica TaxID=871651 RepID=A0A1I0UZX7_9RHOB|nr:NADAR domain-containing protein [Poseidonocella pacifica]SFA69591.1 type I restriction enzyme, S subunit [Poseidonocella pacifica]